MAISPGGRPADDSPVGTPGGQQNWVDKAGGLPKYIRMVAHALMRKGMPKQHAIAAAVNRVKRWAAGADNVRPQVQAAAAAAVAEWEAKKGMALSAHIDAARLLDLAVPEDWQAELEGTFDPTLTLDLAREYVRDQVGKFANDNTKNRGAAQHQAAQDERKQIERNRQVNPRDLSSLKGIRGLMLDWTRIPIGERADLKPRVKAAAKRLGATPRLLALIDGLGDGDFKADKSEGAGVALRKDKANAWLKRAGFNLSADDTEGGLVLELAAAVGDELAENSLIDLAGAPGDVIDLAPGDYRPPYDWKHGFIPVTPAAALSKAKKGPHVGKGNSRRPKGVRVPGKTARGAGGTRPKAVAGKGSSAKPSTPAGKAPGPSAQEKIDNAAKMHGTGSKQHRQAQERFGARAKAEDDERRGRGVPGAVEATHPHAITRENAPTGRGPAQRLDEHGFPDERKTLREMTPAELTAERDRMDNYIKGRAGGTATDVDVDRWRKRKRELNAELERRPGRERQARSREALRAQREGRGNEAERMAQRNRDEDRRQAQSAANVRDTQAKWTEADKRQLNSLPWSRSSARDGQPAVSYSQKHEQALSDLEQRGLIRMDRRGTSAVADDQYVLTDKGKALVGDTDLHKQTQDRAAGSILNMPPPTSSDAAQRAAVKTNQGPGDSPLSTAQLEEMAKNGRPAIKAAAERELAKRRGNVTPIRADGDYPKKADGSPDYGAMSATQQHQVRAKLAGRGEGDKVDTDQGPGTVTRVSSRGTTIRLDSGDSINVVNGTPGHDRIKPRGDSPKGGAGSTGSPKTAEQIRREAIDGRVERDRQAAADTAQRRADTARRGQERRERLANREAAGATDTGKPRRLAADRVLLDGQQYERVVGPNGGYTWRGKGNADVKDMDTRRKLDEAAPLSGSAVAATRIENNRKTEAEGGPSATPPTRTERAMFPEGQKVAYNGRPSDGTGVVVGRRVDSQGTVLEVRDDKDGKTYEWAPDQVKPHDTASRSAAKPDSSPAVAAPASGTTSTNPDAPIRIEHTPDGTLVHGTTREDAADIKAVGGFKWSRNLNAWYLPRTWRPETRENKVKQLEAKLGDKAGVDKTTGPRKSAAEREADTRARAGERAERMDARAASRSAEANRRFEASDLREEKSGIPFGQPILVGHHSERRHRRAIERAHANLGKGVEAQRDAEAASAAADRARRTAAGTESKVTIGNRIAKNEREVRDLERRLAGTHSSSRRVPEGEYRQRLEGMLAEAQDQLQHDRGKMAAAGGVPSKDSVSPGDFVKIRGQWYPVRKSNAKTVGVPNTYGDRTRTAPWHEVSEHRKAGDVTRADVADMVRDTSQAFPNLKTALAKAAPDADPTPDTPAATPGGVTPDAARRMSDEQLERTMQRLMADGDYDGPAFSVIEKELNRRDKARRAEGNQ